MGMHVKCIDSHGFTRFARQRPLARLWRLNISHRRGLACATLKAIPISSTISTRVFSSAFTKSVDNDFPMSIDLRGALPTIIVSAGQVGASVGLHMPAPCMTIANHLNLELVDGG